MVYTKQTWANGASGGTAVNATRMKHIEDGIAAAAAAAVPAGGTTGQVLKKNSSTDYDLTWGTDNAGTGGGGSGGGYGPNWLAASNAPLAARDAVLAAGGVVCDGTGDHADFAAQLATYSHVQFTEGDYNFSGTLTVPARHWLQGSGPDSEIIGGAGASSRLIYVTSDHVALSDFTISAGGESAGTHHIEADVTSSSGFVTGSDACLVVERVVSRNAKGNGIRMTGSFNRDSKLSKIHVWNAASDGYYISSPDGAIVQCVAGTCGGNGFWFDSGSSNWTGVQLKAWYSDLDGFLINGARNKFTAIEGQDNLGAGIRIIGNMVTLTAWVADSNSFDGSAAGSPTGGNVHSGLEIGRTFAGGTSGGFDISIGAGAAWDKNESSRGRRQRSGVRVRSGARGLAMVGVTTGDPSSTHFNVTTGIEFDTAADLTNAANSVYGCVSHRIRVSST